MRKLFTVLVMQQAEGSDDKVEYIGSYSIARDNVSIEVYVYEVTINGKRREVHWNGYSGSSCGIAVLNLEPKD